MGCGMKKMDKKAPMKPQGKKAPMKKNVYSKKG
jgi:hypothetical protein